MRLNVPFSAFLISGMISPGKRRKTTVAPLVFFIPYAVRNTKNEIRTVLPYFLFLCARGIRKTVQDVVFRFSHTVLNVTHETQYSRKFVFRTPCFYFRIGDIRRKCDTQFVFRFSRSTEMRKMVRKTVCRFSNSRRKTKNGCFLFFWFRTTWEKRINGTYTDPWSRVCHLPYGIIQCSLPPDTSERAPL